MTIIPRQPDRYTAEEIKQWSVSLEIDGKYTPARQCAHNAWGFAWRWKLAFAVLTGKADALYWRNQ